MTQMKRTYTIGEKGQITLPSEWRAKYGLKKGDIVSFVETKEGLMILPRVALAMDALDRIGEALKERGISLEELLEDSEGSREDIYNEKYAPKASKTA